MSNMRNILCLAAVLYGEAPKTGRWAKAAEACQAAADALLAADPETVMNDLTPADAATAIDQADVARRYASMATCAGERAEAMRAQSATEAAN